MYNEIEIKQCFSKNYKLLEEFNKILCINCGKFSNPQFKNDSENLYYCLTCSQTIRDKRSSIIFTDFNLDISKYSSINISCRNNTLGCNQTSTIKSIITRLSTII